MLFLLSLIVRTLARVLVLPGAADGTKANACAERWVQTVRAECLDWTLVLGRGHLERLLRTIPGDRGMTATADARRPR